MLRKLVCAVFALVVCGGVLLAAEIKGKIKSVDAEKHTITVTADGKDHVLTLTKDAKVLSSKGEALKEGLKDKHLKPDTEVIVKCEKKDGKEVCSEVKLAQPRKKNQ